MYSMKKRALSVLLVAASLCSTFLSGGTQFTVRDAMAQDTASMQNTQNLWGYVADSNTHTYTKDYANVVAENNTTSSWSGAAWWNDTVSSRIVLYTKGTAASAVTVSAGDFVNAKGEKLPSDCVKVSFIHDTNDHMYGVDVPDVIWNSTTEDIAANSLKSVWVSITVPSDARVGTYTGNINVTSAGGNTLSFAHTVEVIGVTRKTGQESGIALEIWTYPYCVDRYYSGKTSDEYFYGDASITDHNVGIKNLYYIHLNDEYAAQRRAHLELYAKAGGTAITVTCVEDSWGSQTPDPYPSMIKWYKKSDGTFKFDYSDFDEWVQLNMDLGIDQQIKTFSITPWGQRITYFDEALGEVVTVKPAIRSEEWTSLWTAFLRDYMKHTKEKGWFEKTYLAMDEREGDEVVAALDIIESITDEQGNRFKISFATNWNGSQDHYDRMDDISFAYQLANQYGWDIDSWAADRRAAGKQTTLYTCGAQCSALYNSPAESVFSMLVTSKEKVDGFLRWALDSFNEDPFKDGSNAFLPSGDLFLIYPSDVNDTEGNVRSSVRFEKMMEGFRLMAKIKMLREYSADMGAKVDGVLAKLSVPEFGSLTEIKNAQTGEIFHYDTLISNHDFPAEVTAAVAEINMLARTVALQDLIDQARWEKASSLEGAITTAEGVKATATTAAELSAGYQELNEAVEAYNSNDIGGIAANDVVGWENATPTFDARGAKMTIAGGSWANQARINYNRKLDGAFNIENGKTVSFKFKLGMKETGAASGELNGSDSCFFLIVRDVNNPGDELMRIRFNIKSMTAIDNPVEAIAVTQEGATGAWWDAIAYNNSVYQEGERWVTGAPSLDSEYTVAFNKTDLLMTKYNQNDELRPLVGTKGTPSEIGSGAWFHKTVKDRMTNTKAVHFDIQGNNGFTENVDVIVTELNGQSLANDGSKFTTGGLTATLGEVAKFTAVGVGYDVTAFKAKHLWNDDGGVNYSISWTGASTQAEQKGITFKPTVGGQYTVTVKAAHEAFGSATESFEMYVLDVSTVGASIRLKDGSLRFRSKMKKADYDYLTGQGYTLSLGMLVNPASYGEAIFDNADTLNIPMVNYEEEGGYIYFNGVITNFPKAAYEKDINACAYVKFTKASEENVVYGAQLTRSFMGTVSAALADTSDTQTDIYCNQVTVNGAQTWSKYTQAQINALKAFQG